MLIDIEQWRASMRLFLKSFYFTAYIVIHKYDVMYISKTYLDSTVQDNDPSINWHNLIRADDPNDVKEDGICPYFRISLELRQVSTPYFSQCLLCKITMQNKVGFISITYWSLAK